MRGHVRRRGKSWCFVIDIGQDSKTGKRRQRWNSGHPTRKSAEEAMRRALGRLDVGDDPIPQAITLAEFVEQRWLPHLETQGKPRPSTRKRYASLLHRRVLPAIGSLRLDRVRPAHVQAVLDAATRGGSAPRTVAHLRAAVSSAFTMAVRWQLVVINPVRATTTPTPEAPRLVTPDVEQLRALADAAAGTPWAIPVVLATTTGARRGEILGLRWRDVDLERGRARIEETIQRVDGRLAFTPPKTRQARRSVPLTALAVALLRQHRTEQSRRRLALGGAWHDLDLVCERGDGRPIDPSTFTHAFRRIARSVGLEGMRLHDCRHGVATVSARGGALAFMTSRALGHASTSFTSTTYQHADDADVDRAFAPILEAFRLPEEQ